MGFKRLDLEEARSLLQVGGAAETRSKPLGVNVPSYSWLKFMNISSGPFSNRFPMPSAGKSMI